MKNNVMNRLLNDHSAELWDSILSICIARNEVSTKSAVMICEAIAKLYNKGKGK